MKQKTSLQLKKEVQEEKYLYKIVKRVLDFVEVEIEEKKIWDLIMTELVNYKVKK